jgi:hypothetical protein
VKNLYNTIFWGFIFFLPVVLYGQEGARSLNQEDKISFEKKAAPGTYQFIVSAPGSQFIFTDDILVQIEKLRKENEEVLFVASSTVTVRILSRADITRAGFKPLEEIIYKER